ncbi:MAG: prenyltransferase [Spirochaeta sp.]
MKWYVFLRIVEIRTKIISLSTFAIGTLLAVAHGHSLDPVLFVLMLSATLLVDMGTTGFNTFFDYYRGVDAAQHNREKDKVLVHNNVAPGLALIISAGLFAAAVVLGAIIAYLTSWWVAGVGAVCMLVGYVYTGGKHPISATPVGELFAGGFLGAVLFVLSYYVQAGDWGADVVLAAMPSTLLIASILAVNNACDVVGDAAAGRKTLAVLLRPNHSALPIPVLYALGILSAPAAAWLGAIPWAAAIAVVVSALHGTVVLRGMYRRGFSHETKGPNMGAISQMFLIFSLCFLVGLTVSVMV